MPTGYLGAMRTTLTLDDDVAVLLKHNMQVSGQTFRDAVNAALRRGLLAQSVRDMTPIPQPCSMGTVRVDLAQALSLAAGLDDEAVRTELHHHRDLRDRS